MDNNGNRAMYSRERCAGFDDIFYHVFQLAAGFTIGGIDGSEHVLYRSRCDEKENKWDNTIDVNSKG